MIILLSPAKRQAGAGAAALVDCADRSEPLFATEAKRFRELLASLDRDLLGQLFSLSAAKLDEVWDLYQKNAPAHRAVDLFRGPAFSSLIAAGGSRIPCGTLGETLRIFSGLYGYLRPFDVIEAYRLDLEHSIPGAGSLESFWRGRVNDALLSEDALKREPVILDLASREYSRLLDIDRIRRAGVRLIRPDFLTLRDGRRRRLSVHAKQGRGGLAGWLIRAIGEGPAGGCGTAGRTGVSGAAGRAGVSGAAGRTDALLAEARWEGFALDSGEPDAPVYLKTES